VNSREADEEKTADGENDEGETEAQEPENTEKIETRTRV
jgi:hypothetical protein